MRFKNVLVLYKRSAYTIYFTDQKNSLQQGNRLMIASELDKFKHSHEEHYKSLRAVSRLLMTHGVHYTENCRGRRLSYDKFDLVITVGGDGTFLEAARMLKGQVIIGINSAPSHSVGRFCMANAQTFEPVLESILKNRFKIRYLQRLRIKMGGMKEPLDALNDILVCHANPATLCRYILKIRSIKEEQRSSGIWISTPVGSSGAIKSAGGKLLNPEDKKIQYIPRELYLGKNRKYFLKGGVLLKGNKISITSLMRRGTIFFDGAHHHLPFEYGITADVSLSPHPLKTIRV